MNRLTSRLVDASDGRVILEQLEIAETFWRRFVGLQFRRELPQHQALLLSPCSSIHTCFMRFPIDVLMLNAENRLLGLRKNVRPWRAVLCVRGTTQIIETAVGATDLTVGTLLRIESE